MADKNVTVVSPEGDEHEVPESRVAEMPEGWRRLVTTEPIDVEIESKNVWVKDPEGKYHEVPESRVSEMPKDWTKALDQDPYLDARFPPEKQGMGALRVREGTPGGELAAHLANEANALPNEAKIDVAPETSLWDDVTGATKAFTQGASRFYGGDFIRHGFDQVEEYIDRKLNGTDLDKPGVAKSEGLFEDRDHVQANRDAYPTAAAIGETFGIVGQALTPPSKLLTPGAVVGKGAAELGERAITALPAAGVVRPILERSPVARKAVELATRGAAEGSYYSAASEVNDAFLNQDYSNLSEKVVASGMDGFALGAGTSLGLSAAGRVARGAVKAVAANRANRASKLVAGHSQFPDKMKLDDVVDTSTEASRHARSFTTPRVADEVQQQANKNIAENMRAFFHDSDLVDNRVGIAAKKRFLSKFDEPYGVEKNGQESFDRLRSEIGLTDERLAELKSDYGIAGDPASMGRLRNLEKKIEAMRTGSEGIKKDGRATVGEMFILADDLKRALGDSQVSKNEYFRGVMREYYEKLKAHLESSANWPEEAAQAQVAVNQKWAEAIRKAGDSDLKGLFGISSEVADDPFEVLAKMNQKQLGSVLQNIHRAEYQGVRDAYLDVLESRVLDAEMRASVWGGDAIQVRAENMRTAFQNIKNDLAQVKLANEDVLRDPEPGFLRRNAQPILAGAGSAIGGTLGAMAGETAGFAQGGVGFGGGLALGNYVGRMINATGEPRTQNEILELARHYSLTKRVVSTQRAINRVSKLKGILEKREPARAAVPGAVQALQPTEDNREPKTPKRSVLDYPVQAVDKAIDWATRALEVGDPDLQSSLLEIEDEGSPELARAIRDQVVARAQFILDKAGPQGQDPFGRPIPRDPVTNARMGRYLSAIDEPVRALERVSDGEAHDEDQEVLQALYPSMLNEFRQKAYDYVQKQDLTYDQMARASYALGIPLDPTMEPSFMAWVSAASTPQEGPAPEDPAIPQGKVKFQSPYAADKTYASRGDAVSMAQDRMRG